MARLKDFDTVENTVAELKPILIQNANKNKVLICVEGNDWRLYSRFFHGDEIILQKRAGGHSCYSAIDAYREYKHQNPSNLAIVICDADFRRINGDNLETEPDIFYSDCHDHEMMCISQKKVRESLLNNFEYGGDKDAFYTTIFDELKCLSYLKWYNYNYACQYNFEKLGELFGLNDSDFNEITKLEETVYTRTCSEYKKRGKTTTLNRIDSDALNRFVDDHEKADFYEITNGHDFYSRIRKHLQDISKKNVRSEEQLKDSIYSAFEFVFFNTNLYNRLNSWCQDNKQILKVAS